jgi:hypothetical protein
MIFAYLLEQPLVQQRQLVDPVEGRGISTRKFLEWHTTLQSTHILRKGSYAQNTKTCPEVSIKRRGKFNRSQWEFSTRTKLSLT